MVRVHFGTRDISEIMSEMQRLEGCIGDKVDYGYVRKCVDEMNQRLAEKGIKVKIVLQKTVKWDRGADYRLILRRVKR